MHNLFIGTFGYNYRDWKEVFYPEKLSVKYWLEYYSRYFHTVEINATFYHNFERKVYENWFQKTPKDFCFTIKGSRFITHIKRLKNVQEEIILFFDNMSGLKDKLNAVLWQFPASFHNNEENYLRLVQMLEILPEVRNAFEFRHQSWFNENIYNLLNKFQTSFVINDTGAFPTKEKVTGEFTYIRFHGPTSLYSSEELKVWAKKIKIYLKRYDVYCYFNNDTHGYAVENAKELIDILKKNWNNDFKWIFLNKRRLHQHQTLLQSKILKKKVHRLYSFFCLF